MEATRCSKPCFGSKPGPPRCCFLFSRRLSSSGSCSAREEDSVASVPRSPRNPKHCSHCRRRHRVGCRAAAADHSLAGNGNWVINTFLSDTLIWQTEFQQWITQKINDPMTSSAIGLLIQRVQFGSAFWALTGWGAKACRVADGEGLPHPDQSRRQQRHPDFQRARLLGKMAMLECRSGERLTRGRRRRGPDCHGFHFLGIIGLTDKEGGPA